MRTLGLLGGMSWESSAVYYRLLNQGVAARLGGLHRASLRIASVDFADFAALLHGQQWAEIGQHLGQLGAGLRGAGAEALLLATNTMHKVAPEITAASGLPLLHIGDACGAALRAASCQRPGILGTRFTMEDRFLLDRLSQAHGLAPQVPDEASRAELHRIIFEELCCGRILDGSRERLRAMMETLALQGCDSVVLACTELVLLTPPQEGAWPLPLFDTTALHAAAAVDWMLEETR